MIPKGGYPAFVNLASSSLDGLGLRVDRGRSLTGDSLLRHLKFVAQKQKCSPRRGCTVSRMSLWTFRD